MSDWALIATAPEEGTYIIANGLGQVAPCVARAGLGRIVQNQPGFVEWDFGSPATHWMPLPAPPGQLIFTPKDVAENPDV